MVKQNKERTVDLPASKNTEGSASFAAPFIQLSKIEHLKINYPDASIGVCEMLG
ncbi:MAG: hypothetical protein UV01_C0010G0001 [Parcubacteria group bacterium GW2011_GWA2_42_14]|nr:MAG: hypothetical protein UV01_C0010G0001 [Parcubacteria group bacterium GW2011_GWA2_42_14]